MTMVADTSDGGPPLQSSGSSKSSCVTAIIMSREEALAAAAQLLSLTRTDHPNSRLAQKLPRTMTRNIRGWVCPGLSLKHDAKEGGSSSSTSNHSSHQDREQAEEHAVNLLARPLLVEGAADTTAAGGFAENSARQLQQNLYSSFAVLVDSRLHAYSAFFARHALSLSDEAEAASIREKLAEILLVGSQMAAETMDTRFTTGDGIIDDDEGSSPSSSATLTLHVTLDLSIPSDGSKQSKAKKNIPVSFEITGSILGTFNAQGDLVSIEIDLDTHDLLHKMVQQASRVVSTIVETTVCCSSSSSSKQDVQMSRSASFLAMPPPTHLPIRRKPTTTTEQQKKAVQFPASSSLVSQEDGLDLLSRAAAELPIVSPYLSGVSSTSNITVPNLELETEENDGGGVSNLSVDQCADIVDTCLFGGDFSVEPPPFKRAKIEG